MSTATDKAWERFKTNMAPLCVEPASSELATSETAGPAPVVAAVATGSGSASSAAVFEELNQMATDYEDIGQERTADTIRAVAEMYRRHAACTIPRQPRPNACDEARAKPVASGALFDGPASDSK